MLFSRLVVPWKQTSYYQKLKGRLAPGKIQSVVGLTDFPRACWTAAIFDDLKSPVLVVAPTDESAKKVFTGLSGLLPSESILYFPSIELFPYEVYARNVEILVQRTSVLTKLSLKEKIIVVCPVEALVRKMIPPQDFQSFFYAVAVGEAIDLGVFSQKLVDMGYGKEDMVEIPGTFSVRGGIIDIFPPLEQNPLRIEFFDNEIESIRFFDPATQRSWKESDRVLLTPATDIPVGRSTLLKAGERVQEEMSRTVDSYPGNARRKLKETILPYIDHMMEGIWTEGMEQFLIHFYPPAESLVNYLPHHAPVIIYEPDDVWQMVQKIGGETNSLYYDLLEDGKILPSFISNFIDWASLQSSFTFHPVTMFSYLPESGGMDIEHQYEISTRELPSYKGNIQRLSDDVKYYQDKDYQIIWTASSDLRMEKLRELSREMEIRGVEIIRGGVARGFECTNPKILVLSETDIWGQSIHTRPRRTFRQGEKITTFLDLKVGDYVVHVNHGIGRYLGVKRLEVGDIQRDYLHIQYAGDDKLYVPTDQVDLIQKYVGAEGHEPKLYKLGGSEWNRVKSKVRHSVQDMAKELLSLYAAREAVKGHPFSQDTVWQKEFEDSFPYPETPDQIRAVQEIKRDMEKARPMDRLLCGDVGYGKTEVALRAAFKSVMDGKQVAVLVPTTVLAQQHQRTFEERFSGLPVSMGVLSRFKSTKSISETLKGLAQGTVDIVIGTHRLLSKDVKFKDLGLLIIDEEQRFGVAHKEKIKNLKKNIDVLTLSATPIPRTLHMSLVGVRDMSVIETPPEDRQPVQTYVMEYQERVIKEAIQREIARGGQVYFVHNRVQNIFETADQIYRMVPSAKVLVAHGQMREHELERVMMDFVEGNGDVLVCTTIVESGLDIPNVNTLIVDQADHLGLSQLYQLRGRVGRSSKQAFAYFTYRKDKILTGIAKKRLKAIRDFTELGSGFKIAMRDMEIRGAGNILGPEQHGHILAVGFDLYCRLVEEEVNRQRGGEEAVEEKITPLLELNVDAFIPDSYLSETDLKIEVYKRLAGAEEIKEIDNLELEVEDRYGVLPQPVRNLFKLGKIKAYAQKLRISSITHQKNMVSVRFAPGYDVSGHHLAQLAGEFGRRLTFSVSGDLEIKMRAEGSSERIVQMIISLLEKLIHLRSV